MGDMKRYKLIIAYDGTDYHGWQAQKNLPTVVQTLQSTFLTVFNKPVVIAGVSRTDAGVHALGQTATMYLDFSADMTMLMRAWNARLPSTIMIRSLSPVAHTFGLHRDVLQKTYWYHFFQEQPLPFVARYGWHYRKKVAIDKLRDCLTVFVGTHNFRSFSTGNERGDDTIRRIDSVSVDYVEEYRAYRIAITGPRFLRYMVRRIVGACLAVASDPDMPVSILKDALQQENPQQVLPNAPAHGLVLYTIIYTKENK